MSRSKSISLSIACYNDSATIERVVDASSTFLSSISDDWEVMVVDDGSADSSPELLRKMTETRPWLRAIFHEKNLGFGATMSDLYMNNGKEINGLLPGDNQIAPEEMGKMLPHLDSADLVYGYREDRRDTFRRRIASRLFNLCIQTVSGKKIQDVNSVVLYKTRIVDGLDLKSVGAFIHAEFFIRLMRAGCTFKEMPILHREREAGRGAGGRIDVMLFALKEFVLFCTGRL